ncbi:MAG: ribonuclease HII [Proteobacteria bacterium]|nr:ribonuclease HII [Pseudomonadota bacterium]
MTKPRIKAGYGHEAAAAARGLVPVCGIDEAGRGPWAGPVVAAAVILRPDHIPPGLADSKTLSRARREQLFDSLGQVAVIGVGRAGVEEIDRLNILAATMLAMARAVADLATPPRHALVDGNRAPDLPRRATGNLACGVECLVKGDARCLSIAAASIVAKVTRDREMTALAECFPGYGWERNAGYGTAEHRAALARLGPTEMHRRSFAPIRKLLAASGALA